MKAFVHRRYGPPLEVLELVEIQQPAVPGDGVLVKAHAASVNPLDWHGVTGLPYIARASSGLRGPKSEAVGVDFAGTVESVGQDVEQFRPGDEVFGGRTGAFAEYVAVPEGQGIVAKPAGLTFEQAAAVPVAALTALQGLRDKGQLQSRQKVLINGASGGVGTFAVQIAKAFGAEVTGVCRTGNVEMVRSIGADHVIDYTQEDFTRTGLRYDLMLDIAGGRSWSECKRVLTDKARLVVVGGQKNNRWFAPADHLVRLKTASLGGSRNVVPFLSTMKKEDLLVLQELLEAGKVTPVIDRRYEFAEIPEALSYLGEGHAKAKVVIAV